MAAIHDDLEVLKSMTVTAASLQDPVVRAKVLSMLVEAASSLTRTVPVAAVQTAKPGGSIQSTSGATVGAHGAPTQTFQEWVERRDAAGLEY